MSQSQLKYSYPSKTGIRFNEQLLYPKENRRFTYENIEFEDSMKNKYKITNIYLTNFRTLILTSDKVFDIPNYFLNHLELNKPFIGKPHIIYHIQKEPILLKYTCPFYLKDFYPGNTVYNCSILYPEFVKIFFPKETIDNIYNNLLKLFNEDEIIRKKTLTDNQQLEPIGLGKNYDNIQELGLNRIQVMREQQNLKDKKELKNAFSNIQTLKQNAEKMIQLAEKLRAKLDVTKGEEKEINDILKKIGYINPETKETAGSEFYDKLASQINIFFNDYFNKNQSTKVLSLIDAYCIYNRARGIELISPKDMKQAVNKLKLLPNQNIFLKSLKNEIWVLYSSDYTSDNIIKTMKKFMSDNNKDYLTVNDIKKILNIENMILFKYLIDDLLINGKLCSDESDIEVNYYMNIISSYQFNYNY